MSADTPDIDWDTYEPSRAVRKAAMVLFEADSVEAMCFGWVPQARDALATALDAVDVMELLLTDHRLLTSYSGFRCGCGDWKTGSISNPEAGFAKHQADAIRAAILGADS